MIIYLGCFFMSLLEFLLFCPIIIGMSILRFITLSLIIISLALPVMLPMGSIANAMNMPQNMVTQNINDMPDCHENMQNINAEVSQSCCDMIGDCDTNCMMQQGVLSHMSFSVIPPSHIQNAQPHARLIAGYIPPLKRPPRLA